MVDQPINLSGHPGMSPGVPAYHHDCVATEVQRDHHNVLVALGAARLRTVQEVPIRALSLEEDWINQLRMNRFLVRTSVAYENAIREMPRRIWKPFRRLPDVQQVSRTEQVPPVRPRQPPMIVSSVGGSCSPELPPRGPTSCR